VEARLDAWREALGRTHLPFAVALSHGSSDAFSAEVHEQYLGDLTLVDALASPHRGRRTRRQLSASTRDVVGLQYVIAGRELIEFGDESEVVGPGDLVLWDGDANVSYEVIEPLRKRSLIMPRPVAAAVLPGYRDRFLAHASKAGPAPNALIGLMTLLSTELTAMDNGARAASATLALQLVRTLDPGGRERRGTRCSGRDLRDRVLQYVEDNLGDPALSPATIAAAHAVSVRTLYCALEGMGTTLAAHIRNQRLAHCHAELARGSGPVADVAFRWGFRSHAHFSRIFRERYDLAPSQVDRLDPR